MDDKKTNEQEDLFLPLLTAMLIFNGQPQQSSSNIDLEKEVAYLHGKVDTLEKIIVR